MQCLPDNQRFHWKITTWPGGGILPSGEKPENTPSLKYKEITGHGYPYIIRQPAGQYSNHSGKCCLCGFREIGFPSKSMPNCLRAVFTACASICRARSCDTLKYRARSACGMPSMYISVKVCKRGEHLKASSTASRRTFSSSDSARSGYFSSGRNSTNGALALCPRVSGGGTSSDLAAASFSKSR